MRVLSTLIIIFLSLNIFGQASVEKRQANFNLEEDHIAIRGYDPITYFTLPEPLKGHENISYTYKDITYWFLSKNNRDLFKADPEKFEPKYGGWCAYQMGKEGEKVSVDPETFEIRKGQLYLFYNGIFRNTLKPWQRKVEELKPRADEHWAEIMKE